MEEGGRISGVLALYRSANDAFSAEDLVALLPLCPAIASILVELDALASDTRNLAASIQRENEEARRRVSADAARRAIFGSFRSSEPA